LCTCANVSRMIKDDRPRARKKKGDKDKSKPRRIVLYLPPELAKRFVVRCAEHDRSISDMGTEAIERYLLVTS
jgi:hypothetical protein